jgi:hypothetical protein
VVVAEINVQAEATVPAPHVLGAARREWMHCTIMSFGSRSGTREFAVRFGSKASGTGRSGSSSQRPLGLSSRVAFCYLPSPAWQERLSDPGVPEIAVSHSEQPANATRLSNEPLISIPRFLEPFRRSQDAARQDHEGPPQVLHCTAY